MRIARFTWTLGFSMLAVAQTAPHPTGPRITPPTLNSVSPQGVARGTTVEMIAEGLNLAGASAVHFSDPGVKGRVIRVKELPDLPDVRLGSNGTPSTIDLGPLPPRNQVTMEVEIAPEAAVGAVNFRLETPLGTSPSGRFLVEPYFGEAPDKEPNDLPEGAFEAFLPAVLAGSVSRPGDVDHFKIRVEAGEEVVFENQAPMIGSTLQPVIAIVDASGTVLHETGYAEAESSRRFSYRFAAGGDYYVRVADYEKSGKASHTYRILAGRLPVVTSAYPLGVGRNAEASIRLAGYNLGDGVLRLKATGESGGTIAVRPKTPEGDAYNEVRLAVGDDPEIESKGGNATSASALALAMPVTVNGRIARAAPQWFRFSARKGQRVVMEVEAQRLGSDLDSMLDVFDAAGKPIERAVARATWETSLVLRDHDSAQRGLRIQSWNLLAVGDYVMAGNEICRVNEVPDGPDEDMTVDSFRGQRISYFGTSGQAHGIDQPIYKVQMHPPGAQFSPNGLPVKRIYYGNDDGGPGYGKDSFLEFTAPSAGDYLVRLSDIRGQGGDAFPYRLHVREPRPDFRLSADPGNLNVPRGGTIPVTVTAERREGYEGPIEVRFDGSLAPGLRATENTIAAGQVSCTLLLSADANASSVGAVRFGIVGKATIADRTVSRIANERDGDPDALQLIAIGPAADIEVRAATRVVEIEPGQTADIVVRVHRANGFAGRVPIEVRDLPDRVRVADSGLNGVLVNEDEKERSFRILALPNAEPVEGYVYVSGRVETRSGQQNSYASPEAVLVRVKGRLAARAQQ
ncbi:MAG: hypothetical protein R2762_10865 [Bryobacteraceae bacterium]